MGLLILFSVTLSAQERWVYRYDGPASGSDRANSVAVGLDGNIYAAGESEGDGTDDDFIVVSLTNLGGERWVYRLSGSGSLWDVAYSITQGLDGNLYAAGFTWEATTSSDFAVVSLTTSGAERWVYRYDGPVSASDMALSVAAGSDGHVYAAGESDGSGTDFDFTVVSLTDSGRERWVYRYNGPANNEDQARSITVGSDGNIYAAGESRGSGTLRDFTVVSLTAAGDERWVYRYDGPASGTDRANSIVMGSDGNIYAAGESFGSGTSSDFTVVSLTAAGGERWVYRHDGSANGTDRAYSVIMGSDGHVYVAGESEGRLTDSDFTVISLTASGTERWVFGYDGPASATDRAASVLMGSDGNVYAAGHGFDNSTSFDFTVVSLTESGGERWAYRYDGPGSDWDHASSIVMGADGYLYAAGYSTGSRSGQDLTVLSLGPDLGVEERDRRTARSQLIEMSVSPIPTSSGLKIHYTLPEAAQVKLSVYDVSGRLIKNLVNTREESGSKIALWDRKNSEGLAAAPGTYFVRLEASGVCVSRKCVLL
jgi:uncharacterized delta-60 repeat protein